MSKHRVKQGECLSSIAARHGFGDWKTIYDHPRNSELRRKRPNPHLLFPGDDVFIPEKNPLPMSVKTGEFLMVTLTVPMRRVCVTVLDGDDEPLGNQPWVIEGRYAVAVGTTDGSGRLETDLPAQLGRATLEVAGLIYELELAGLDPLDDAPDSRLSGLRGRLANLGYEPNLDEPEMTEATRTALAAFQRDHGLEGSGEATSETLSKLEEVHGC